MQEHPDTSIKKKIRGRRCVDNHMDSQANLEKDLVNDLILVKKIS